MRINNKIIPNFITLIRIIGTGLLIFTEAFSTIFYILYILCGLSDVLDGYIARKFNLSSKFGARLDSLADAFFIISMIIKILPRLELELWMIILITLIFAIKILSFIIGFLRFNEVGFLHSYSNKIAGIFIFFSPIIYRLFGMYICIYIVCSIAIFSALEELFINILVKKLDINVKGVYKVFKRNYKNNN